jgi:hypothetical protein
MEASIFGAGENEYEKGSNSPGGTGLGHRGMFGDVQH